MSMSPETSLNPCWSLASLSTTFKLLRISGSCQWRRRNSTHHPLVRRICAFSRRISLTGEVLSVPDCRGRSDRAGCRKWKRRIATPSVVHISWVPVHRQTHFQPPFFTISWSLCHDNPGELAKYYLLAFVISSRRNQLLPLLTLSYLFCFDAWVMILLHAAR